MSRLNPLTKLSIALALHPDVLPYVVALNPQEFERLNNPLMRKTMPPRITLARLAKMTNMLVEDLIADIYRVAKIEFEESGLALSEPHELPQNLSEPPEWFMHEPAAIVDLLEADERLDTDPFVPLFPALKRINVGEILLMKHKWEPQPLYDVWTKLGVEYYAVEKGPAEWWIYLRKGRESYRTNKT